MRPAFRKILYRVSFVILASLINFIVLDVLLENRRISFRARLPDLVYGTGYKPPVTRILLPGTVRLILGAVPPQTKLELGRRLLQFPRGIYFESNYLLEYILASFLAYLCFWGFLYSLRALFKALFVATEIFADAVALLGVLGLILFFRNYGYLYDPPILFCFTLTLVFMVREKWKWFLVSFVLSCLSKETAILISMIFVIHYYRCRKLFSPLFLKLLMAQLLIFSIIRGALSYIYRNNPGGFVEIHLFDSNIPMILYDPAIVILTLLFVLIPMGLWVFYDWSNKPAFLKSAIWIVIPLFISQTLFGLFDEWRQYLEAYPIVLLLMIATLRNVKGISISARTT